MVQENTDVKVDITSDDVQAVMQSNPLMALQVQNRALMRRLGEAQLEIAELTASIKAHMDTHPDNSYYAAAGGRGDILSKKEG